MAAHMLDHFVFAARRVSERTKNIIFVIVAFAIIANFWWFRGVAWGIDGPINEHWGLGWRQVRSELLRYFQCQAPISLFADFFFASLGTFTNCIKCYGARATTRK